MMQKIEISKRTITFTIFFILFLYFVWLVRELLFSLLIAFILMSALKPVVNVLEEKKVPRKLAAILIYFSFVLFFIYLFSIIVPPIVVEITALVRNLPNIIKNLANPTLREWLQLETITQYIPNVTQQAFAIIGEIFSNIFFVVTTLVFGFYFILEENTIEKFVARLFTAEQTQHIVTVFQRAEKRMSAWFWGQITLMFVVGVFTFIGLNLIGVRYALALAVLAGLLEVVPNLGPILSAIPAVLIGMSMSYVTGFATLALYFLVQQLENTLIVPMIMRKAVGLDPIITLIALIIGGKIGGVLGVLLAIPLLLFVGTFYLEIKNNKTFKDVLS